MLKKIISGAKGDITFKIAVYSSPPPEKTQPMGKALALDVLSKL